MRKKYLLIILPAMLVTLCLLVGGAYIICTSSFPGLFPSRPEQQHPVELQMNRKYYYTLEATQSIPNRDYYVFYKNGTGDFHVACGPYNYTIHFQYSISFDTITCTYMAVYFDDWKHTSSRDIMNGGNNVSFHGKYADWSERLTLSGDTISTRLPNGNTIYYCSEDSIKEVEEN